MIRNHKSPRVNSEISELLLLVITGASDLVTSSLLTRWVWYLKLLVIKWRALKEADFPCGINKHS